MEGRRFLEFGIQIKYNKTLLFRQVTCKYLSNVLGFELDNKTSAFLECGGGTKLMTFAHMHIFVPRSHNKAV